MENIFSGYKIIELSSVLAGPYAGMMFSELGAEVIKIENKVTKGDVTRTWRSSNENKASSVSSYYSSINYKKQVRFLDLTSFVHINEIYELIKTADVVITNFKKGDDFKFALDYGRVKVINSQIVYAKLTGFESYPSRVAYDVVVQAECGFMSMNGQASSPPTKMPVALMDVLAGHQLRSGILSALLKKEKTKKGSLVEVSLERAGIAALVNQGSNYLMNGEIAERIGSRHPNIALYGEVFSCSDNKDLVMALGSQKHFELLCNAIKAPGLIENKLYDTNQSRLTNLDELCELIQKELMKQPSHYWIEMFNNLKIPFGEIKDLSQVSASNLGKEMILNEKIDDRETKRFSTVAFKIT